MELPAGHKISVFYMVAAALMQQIILRAVENLEFRSSILSKWFTVSFVTSQVESYAVVLKLGFKGLVNANPYLLSMKF